MPDTIASRMAHALEFGQGNAINQVVRELQRHEDMLTSLPVDLETGVFEIGDRVQIKLTAGSSTMHLDSAEPLKFGKPELIAFFIMSYDRLAVPVYLDISNCTQGMEDKIRQGVKNARWSLHNNYFPTDAITFGDKP